MKVQRHATRVNQKLFSLEDKVKADSQDWRSRKN